MSHIELNQNQNEDADKEVGDEHDGISLQVIDVPQLLRPLALNDHARLCLILQPGIDDQNATRREQDSISDTERGEDGEEPSQSIAVDHRDWDLLQGEDQNGTETSSQEVQEESEDLCVDVRREHEGGHVREGHDGWRVEQEQGPDTLVLLREEVAQQDDEEYRDVGHEDVEEHV